MRTAALLAIALAIMPLLAGCGSAEDSASGDWATTEPIVEPVVAAISTEEALDQYASNVVGSNAADFSGHEPAFTPSSGRPPTYVIKFQTVGTEYLTKKSASDNDKAGYEANIRITNRWQEIFCTPELRRIMRSHGVLGASGQIVDSSGQDHSLAICTV